MGYLVRSNKSSQGPETAKSHEERRQTSLSNFYLDFMSGSGLDIGCGNGLNPVLESAIGVDTGYPGYNGLDLPFESESQDYVFSSHCLEHLTFPTKHIREWFRVIKEGGFLIITVPHKFLYEKRETLPSKYNTDHKRFYTPSTLLNEIEVALEPNSYRVRLLRDNDRDFDYSIPPEQHSKGCYEIECVIQKIRKPEWTIY